MEKEKKYTSEDLKEMQTWPLERKIQVTQTRLIEWYQHYDGKVYVSFSGGKDSTVLLDMARRIYPDIEAVFIDTGLEYPEIRKFVKTFDGVTWLKPKMNFRQVIEKYGYPLISKEQAALIQECRTTNSEKLRAIRLNGNKYGRGKISKRWVPLIAAPFKISDKCCDVMKKSPAKQFEKRTGKTAIIATMATESGQRASNWMMYGCNAFSKKRSTSQPMSFWTEQDVLLYLKRFNIPYASVYGEIVEDDKGNLHTTGCIRTGCVFCAFGAHLEKEPNRFQRLRQTHPKLWEYCMKPWSEGGLGMKEVLESIDVKIE
jgi:3'-phosphoadenosine 5'-phosphosulfate sulfotransferase (PAPS reductase)/FAD synthetase